MKAQLTSTHRLTCPTGTQGAGAQRPVAFPLLILAQETSILASEDVPTSIYKVSPPLRGSTNLFLYKKYTYHTQPCRSPTSLERLDSIRPVKKSFYGHSAICSTEEQQAPRVTCKQLKRICTHLTKCQAQVPGYLQKEKSPRHGTPVSWLHYS